MAIQNRYEFIYYVECLNGNPNGDPDMGNAPRMDPLTQHGLISDVATKRRIRNYIEMAYAEEPGMSIMVQQATNINRFIASAKRAAGVEDCSKTKEDIYAGRKKACELFFDVRAFGGVLSTGPNAGQVRGPVQITIGKSLEPIMPSEMAITRMSTAESVGGDTVEEYLVWEEKTPEDKMRTMGRKSLISHGLYEVRGFISANLAAETGFDDEDLQALFEAIMNMYEHDRSSSKGQMSVVSPLIIFKHVGNDSNKEQRVRQAKLGCAKAHKLFELISVQRRGDVEVCQSYKDYDATVDIKGLPSGVEIGFYDGNATTWGKLPETERWFKTV